VILTEMVADPEMFAARTGWTAKPQGLCQGEMCVPAPGAIHDDGRLDIPIIAERLGMPLVRDNEHDVWALGPASPGGHTLATAAAPDPILEDRDGNPFRLSALHGRKVLLVAWASW
jgi:hypothetical protein